MICIKRYQILVVFLAVRASVVSHLAKELPFYIAWNNTDVRSIVEDVCLEQSEINLVLESSNVCLNVDQTVRLLCDVPEKQN